MWVNKFKSIRIDFQAGEIGGNLLVHFSGFLQNMVLYLLFISLGFS